jgi:hypothetical protein
MLGIILFFKNWLEKCLCFVYEEINGTQVGIRKTAK